MNIPTLNQIIDRIKAQVNAKLPQSRVLLANSLAAILMEAFGGVFFSLYKYLPYQFRQTSVATCEQDQLLLHGNTYGIAYKYATAASGNVLLSGPDNTVINDGTELTEPDTGLTYHTLSEGIIINGVVSVPARAFEVGINTNLADDTPLLIDVVDVTAAVETMATGSDDEPLEDYRTRILERIQYPAMGGSVTDFKLWALSQPNVDRAWVDRNGKGLGTVVVVFTSVAQTDGIPTQAEINALDTYLKHDDRRPAGATIYVEAPLALVVNVVVQITPNNADTREQVKRELFEAFKSRAVPGNNFSRSWLQEAVSIAAGEEYSTVISPMVDIMPGVSELPTLGSITFSSSQ